MNAKRGYYSLVQFCPIPARAEAVNVGVVLFCPEAGFLAARTCAGAKAAAKLVGREGVDPAELEGAKQAIERRLQVDRDSFSTLEDFQAFAETRANLLKLTSPRPVKVGEPERELDQLFHELVGGRPRSPRRGSPVPQLDEVFRRLEEQGRARRNITVPVPYIRRRLHVPYLYRNGTTNLVTPQRFAPQEGPAMRTAERLAIEGDLLQKHGQDEQGKKRLIVVSLFEPGAGQHDLAGRVSELLGVYEVTCVREHEVPEFAARVEKEAH